MSTTDHATEPAQPQRPPIPLEPVQSKQIKAIGYDEGTQTLAVEFTSGKGGIYHYPNVALDTAQAFRQSESAGSFFWKHIKPLPFQRFPNP